MVVQLFAKMEDSQAALTEVAALHAPADAMIRGIYTKRVAWTVRRTAYQEKMRCAYATVKSDPYASAALHRLLNYSLQRTDGPDIELVVPSLGPKSGNTFLDGLLIAALRHTHWQQAPELRQPADGSPRQQFRAFLTIEVDNTRRAIVQVRARCNRLLSSGSPSPRMQMAETILRRWAAESSLTIACML